jgi:uncharacterized protein YbbC (DUF1343 family)/CubicO group peptidase (beta-lactamase class C family)
VSKHLRRLCICVFVGVLPLNLAALADPAAGATKARSSQRLAVIDAIIKDAIERGNIPGAVVLVGHNRKVVYRKAFGYRSLEPRRERMTAETIFDMASLTKVIATTTCVMQLIGDGKIKPNDTVAHYLPEFAQNGKEDITVRQLLTHYSGLAPDLNLDIPWTGKATAYGMAFAEAPRQPPGAHFVYSDINFIVLGALIERVSNMTLENYASTKVFEPLGMLHTRFLPPVSWRAGIAPSEYDEQHVMLRGVVHDPTARRMGGVAGHAGLFSTADDLSKFCQALLSGSKVLSRLLVEKMSTPQQAPNATAIRGFGWDIDSPFSSNRGDLLPVGSFGHTGFTGTSIWIDPTTNTYIILLTNAVHPRGKGAAISLRTRLATAVADALPLTMAQKEKLRWESITGYNEAMSGGRRISNRNGSVKSGIDVLEAHNFDILRGTGGPRKIGLLTNQTGIDADGVRTIDVLAHVPGVSLDAIFSPEHGVTGTLDTTDVANSKDAATGVPVLSVYGAKDSLRRPSVDVLKKLHAVVVDIQDAGVRFYTYESTVGYFLEAAAKAGIEIIVLDRPNPVTGSFVQGPVADVGRESFVSYGAVPVRHGMTLGELARMFNEERNIHARLQVVPMEGWMRGDWFDSTGLTWVNPSPNLRSVTEAALYPGVGLVEGTNVSVGRGTDTPFELLGAPWIKGREFATYLNGRNIPGVRFVATTFTPTENRQAGQLCGGVNIVLIERNALDAPELGVELAGALHKLYPAQFQTEKLIDLIMNQATVDALLQGEDPRRIMEDWRDSLQNFQTIRAKYLVYK